MALVISEPKFLAFLAPNPKPYNSLKLQTLISSKPYLFISRSSTNSDQIGQLLSPSSGDETENLLQEEGEEQTERVAVAEKWTKDRHRAARVAWEKLVRWSPSLPSKPKTHFLQRTNKRWSGWRTGEGEEELMNENEETVNREGSDAVIVEVNPNPCKGLVSKAMDLLEKVIGKLMFDGDGMIHGLRIKGGHVSYVSRYVRTSRLKQEEFFGEAKFMRIGDLKGLLGLFMVNMQMLREKLKVLDVSYGIGTANTALIYHHGNLLALSDGDKPYALRVLENGDLQTLGVLDYDKRLSHSFTAHPKVDPFTGEMFTFGYSCSPPYVTYRVISKDGFMHDPVPITIPAPVMMHDFSITENYAIFMDLPMYFRPKEMVKENKFIFSFDSTKKACFGVLPRYAKNESLIKWFELPNCFIFHNANAWEDGDEIVLITCRLENPDLDMVSGAVKERPVNFLNQLYEMRFNMKTGFASQRQLSASAVDFPRINESYTGRRQRYVYCTILDNIARIQGVVKFDLQSAPDANKPSLEVGGTIEGIFDLGPGRFGSEAIFVPRVPNMASEEDDGFLIFFVHDESTGKSYVNVIDAKTMSVDPVAVVELPCRVPYGFHAFFVTEEQLKCQRM